MNRSECRISAVSDDWAMKGCHVHVGRVEVSIHPDNFGGVTYRSPFSSTTDKELAPAIAVVKMHLADASFLTSLISAVGRASEHMPSVEGFWAERANGRLFEFMRLLRALHRMQVT